MQIYNNSGYHTSPREVYMHIPLILSRFHKKERCRAVQMYIGCGCADL